MKKVVLLIAAGIFLSIATNAQKIGYINSTELMQSMPEYTKAVNDIQAYQKQYIDQGKAMYDDYQKKIAEYQKSQATWNDAMKETKQKEISDLEKRMQDLDSTMQAKVNDKQAELMKPVYDKAKNAIQAVGKDNGYEYIMDVQNILYAKDEDNVIALVKAKLGIK